MVKFLFLILLFVFTSANADDHGSRLTLISPSIGTILTSVIRTRPTIQENHDICVSDGEFLLTRHPTFGYTCERE
jgi:hypothetical protein